MKFKVIEISWYRDQHRVKRSSGQMWTKPETQCPPNPGPKIIDFDKNQ